MFKKKVLATSWHPGGANAIVPVIKKLQSDGKVNITVLGHQYSEAIYKAAGIPYNTLRTYGLKDVSEGSMAAILAQEIPDLVLTGTSVQDEENRDVIEQTITLAARKRTTGKEKRRATLTLAVIDVWSKYSQRFSDLYDEKTGRHIYLPDQIAIMDEYAQNKMLAEGFNPFTLSITGNPDFDNLEELARNFTQEDIRRIREQIGLNPTVLGFYAAGLLQKNVGGKKNFGFWDLDCVRAISEALGRIHEDQASVAVTLHPRHSVEDARTLVDYLKETGQGRIKLIANTKDSEGLVGYLSQQPSEIACVTEDIGSYDLVLASDLTMTALGAIGIKAAIMGKPGISIRPNSNRTDFQEVIIEPGIIEVEYDPAKCADLVQRGLTDGEFRRDLEQRASSFSVDGSATGRVIDLIYGMLNTV